MSCLDGFEDWTVYRDHDGFDALAREMDELFAFDPPVEVPRGAAPPDLEAARAAYCSWLIALVAVPGALQFDKVYEFFSAGANSKPSPFSLLWPRSDSGQSGEGDPGETLIDKAIRAGRTFRAKELSVRAAKRGGERLPSDGRPASRPLRPISRVVDLTRYAGTWYVVWSSAMPLILAGT